MKNKQNAIMCLLIAILFLLPLIGNSASAASVTYYFDSWDRTEEWETYPGYMVDGWENLYASTTIDGDVQLCDGNTAQAPGPFIPIRKVEIRAKGYANAIGQKIILRPVFGGTADGDNHIFNLPTFPGGWSQWFDITYDTNAPRTWTWSDVVNLDCDVEADISNAGLFTVYCSMIQIRVSS